MNKILIAVVLLLLGLVIEFKYGVLRKVETKLAEHEAVIGESTPIKMLSSWESGDYKKNIINESTMVLEIPVFVVGEDTLYKKVTVKYLNGTSPLNNPLSPSTWYIMEGN